MKRLPLPLFLVMLSLVFLAACGYRVLGSEPRAEGIRPRLAIPLFTNRSNEVGLEAIFANALIRAFSQSRVTRVTDDEKRADVVLRGRVQKVESSSLAYQDIDRSLVRRVTLTVELTLKKQRGGTVLWKETRILTADYVVNPNYHIGEVNRQQSIHRAAATMAQQVHDQILMIL